MPKINIATSRTISGSSYPAPYDEPCRDRQLQVLGEAAGLTQFGVNLVRLRPGVWSSQRHWHEREDEFVWVLEGEVVLVTDAGRETLLPGECAGFKAGIRDGHHLINESETDTLLLVIGTRDDRDHGEYPDIDMRFQPARYSGDGSYETKDGTKLG